MFQYSHYAYCLQERLTHFGLKISKHFGLEVSAQFGPQNIIQEKSAMFTENYTEF